MECNTTVLRRDLMIRLVRILLKKKPLKEIDRIPVEMTPRSHESTIRCCIYRERAVTRSGIIALLGFDNTRDDEIMPLSEYALQRMQRPAFPNVHLTVLQEGCSHCPTVNYVITDACRGCVARPCTSTCPRNAISIKQGRAHIDETLCINCGKCKEVCPFHAITYVPVPCEEACPVGAIVKDEHGQTVIDRDTCILCGKCKVACPFGAIFETSQLVQVITALQNHVPVVAMVAPAIAGQFPVEYTQLVAGIRQLGFAAVADVGYGADCTAAAESAEWQEYRSKGTAFMTSSCCPAYIQLVNRHVPQLQTFVSSTPSPMIYTAQAIKTQWPDAVTVFIGPCLAKKQEAMHTGEVDYVISFEELGALLAAADIQLQDCSPAEPDWQGSALGNGFARSGGVCQAMQQAVKTSEFSPFKIDGITKKTTIPLLKAFAGGKAPGTFIEVMACQGGCISGPNSLNNSKTAYRFLENHLAHLDVAEERGRKTRN
jgi:[FeFe] hydrogenase (group B1/B3)